jgi:hypothetical protein
MPSGRGFVEITVETSHFKPFAGSTEVRQVMKHLDVIVNRQGRAIIFDITDAYNTLTVGLDDHDV